MKRAGVMLTAQKSTTGNLRRALSDTLPQVNKLRDLSPNV
jgi:hypothetical protein